MVENKIAEAPDPVRSPEDNNAIVLTSGNKGGWNKELNKPLKPNKKYVVDNYTYHTDDLGRVVRVTGQLVF